MSFSKIQKDFKSAAISVGTLAMTFGALTMNTIQAQDRVDSALRFDGISLNAAPDDSPDAAVERTKFVDRLSFFTPGFTKHLGADGYEYNEINFGMLLGVNLNKNPNSMISTTLYGGAFKNSYNNTSFMVNVAFETRRGLGVMGVKDVLGVGVGFMVAHYPRNSREYVVGPVPYIKLLTGNRPLSLQLGYIAVNDGRPSLTGGTLVLSFTSHLSSLFDWAQKTRKRMNSQMVDDYSQSSKTLPFQPQLP